MALRIENLHIEYPGKPVFDDVNLDVADDEIVAVRSGVLDGATSLLRAIGGYLTGVEGHVWLDDQDLLVDLPSSVRCNIGYVYETNGLVSLYSVFQNIALPLQFHTDMNPRAIETAVRETGDLLNLDPQLYDMRPFELNDVQTRMITLARALVVKPALLLIDELEGGMSDDDLQATMVTLRERQRAHPMSVMMTTASDMILSMADRKLGIDNRDLVALSE